MDYFPRGPTESQVKPLSHRSIIRQDLVGLQDQSLGEPAVLDHPLEIRSKVTAIDNKHD